MVTYFDFCGNDKTLSECLIILEEERVYFGLQSIIRESQGRDIKTGGKTDRGGGDTAYCLAFQACSAYFLNTAQDHPPRNSPIQEGLALLDQSLIKKMAPKTHLQACFSVEVPSSEMTGACVKLT